MSRVITFSRTYPSYHPRKGEPTYFVEAILKQLGIDYTSDSYYDWLREENIEIDSTFLAFFWHSLKADVYPKSHTIRAHKRPLKVGNLISPKCWAGKPYNKTKEGYWQIKFAPDIEVKKTLDFTVKQYVDYWYIDFGSHSICIGFEKFSIVDLLAKNDGLERQDFFDWLKFPSSFIGQIICWNQNINY